MSLFFCILLFGCSGNSSTSAPGEDAGAGGAGGKPVAGDGGGDAAIVAIDAADGVDAADPTDAAHADGAACRPIGISCYESDTCCQGTCEITTRLKDTKIAGKCCWKQGPCDPGSSWPDGPCCLGSTCNHQTAQCEPMKCIAADWGDCAILPNVPCCDSRMACTEIGAGSSRCCIPDQGSITNAAEASLCCSGSYYVGGGKIVCGPPP